MLPVVDKDLHPNGPTVGIGHGREKINSRDMTDSTNQNPTFRFSL